MSDSFQFIPEDATNDEMLATEAQRCWTISGPTTETPKKRLGKSTLPSGVSKRSKRGESSVSVPALKRSLAFDPNVPLINIADIKMELDEQQSQAETVMEDESWNGYAEFLQDTTSMDTGYGSDKAHDTDEVTMVVDVESDENKKQGDSYKMNPTISQDSMKYKHITTIKESIGRTVIISIDPRSHGDFTQIKVFKKFPNCGFFRRSQQISLRTVEAERILLQSQTFVDHAMQYIMNGWSVGRKVDNVKFKGIDAATDERNSQWSLDVTTTANRLVRVSLITYDCKQPLVTTYFQVKLFKKGTDGVYIMEQWLTLTLQELEGIANEHKLVLKGITHAILNLE